ncbi:acyl-CoA dehydrogenase family protein [Catenulispora yoronensis]
MLSWALRRWGSDAQRERWESELARGTTLGAFCLSEPGAGSDAAGIASTAVESGGGWTLNGTKKWITNGQRADLYLVFARTAGSIGAFLVPRDTPACRCARSRRSSAPGPRCSPRSPSATSGSGRSRCWAPAASPPGWS